MLDCFSFRIRRHWTVPSALLLALLAVGLPARAQGPATQPSEVRATGPESVSALEDRVEIFWSSETPIALTSQFRIKRDGILLGVASSTESTYEDRGAVPGTTYLYCVDVLLADGTEISDPTYCDEGSRVIARPTSFRATKGQFEEHVLLTWADQSQIEGGYNIYRDAGNALAFDGRDDYVETPGTTLLEGSFTVEFWAQRASTGTPDFVVNIESTPQGDPVRENLEIGFTSDNRFSVAFGTDLLNTAASYTDAGWHHWAVVYDAPDRRRFVYRDGELVANDIVANAFSAEGVLEFGRRRKGGNATARGHYDGRLDEIRQWGRALTREEVVRVRGALLDVGEAGLVHYWPMDATTGLAATDVVGSSTGSLVNTTAASWVASGVPDRYAVSPPNITAYIDGVAAPGFESYTYRIGAFEDVDGDGAYTVGQDFESEQRTDTGWRGRLSPPGDVVASDGQFLDRVRVIWTDRSGAEDGFYIYREGTRIGMVAAGAVLYDDMTAALEQPYEYCVTSFGAGAESTRACDIGQRGGLPAPDSLVASVDEFDDRITLTWIDSTNTGQGFELYRSDAPFPTGGTLQEDDRIATLGADARQYNDLTAAQGVDYHYCVRSFSELDPQVPSYSAAACTELPGRRAIVLAPTELVASDAEFEDRVELKWKNPSTTAMLFLVYRDDTLIEVLDRNITAATDRKIPSDTDIPYCVSAATVVNGSAQAAQATVAQVLYDFRVQDAAREGSGIAPSTAEVRMDAVYSALGFESEGGLVAASAFEAGYVESDSVCATGSRSMAPPTEVTASDDEFEGHVRVEWTDNSQVETGYRVFRSQGTSAPVLIDSLSANRTTYLDFRGTPGQPFDYTVEAFDAYGMSASASDGGQRTLEPPTQFTASDGTSETTVQLAWKDNSAAELGYRVYRRPVGSTGPFALIDSTGPSDPGYADMVPADLRGTAFEYRVAAFDGYGESLRATTTGRTFIQAPSDVNASSVYSDRIVVVWVDRSAVEEDYVLTRRQVGTRDVSAPVVLAPNTTSYTDTDPTVVIGPEYEYCLQTRVTSNGAPLLTAPVCDRGRKSAGGSGGGGPIGPEGGPVLITTALSGASFGFDVAANEDGDALIGLPRADPKGQANFYSADSLAAGGAPGFSIVPDQPPPDRTGENSGSSVGLSRDYLVIGDPLRDGDTKGTYRIWKRDGDQWIDWTFKQDGTNSGIAADVSGSHVLVGDNEYGTNPSRHGGAIVCDAASDKSCIQFARLEDAAPASGVDAVSKGEDSDFGRAVAITRSTGGGPDALYAIVGAPGERAAYIFECALNLGCNKTADWTLAVSIEAPDVFDEDGTFGAAVAIDGGLAVIGDPTSRAISVWERGPGASGTWSEQENRLAESPEYGAAVAVLESTVIVGAPGETVAEKEEAGAAYVYTWDGALADETRYDASVANARAARTEFGASVEVTPSGFLVGAPLENGGSGSVYYIPRGSDPSVDAGPVVAVEINAPENVAASDGTTPDRIQVRWTDTSENEKGHVVYRSTEGGGFERLAEVSANVEFYDDFAAAPGEAYTYCVAAFDLAPYTESGRGCDIGWRPPNGTIAGRVATRSGAGTDEAVVCLSPSLNRGLILDGAGGHVVVALDSTDADDRAATLAFQKNFTIEAWIRPQTVSGTQTILVRDSSYALQMVGTGLEFSAFETGSSIPNTFSAAVGLSAGDWHHVAVVREDNNDVAFYLDGALFTSITNSLLVSPKADSTSLWIGQAADSTRFFRGEIDEVRVWSIARDSAEIAGAYQSVLTGREESLAAYWPLDDGARRIVPDITAAANHGNLVSGVYATSQGADLNVCGETSDDGNYSISRIRYGETREFDVIPTRAGRRFTPGFKKITLSTDSPVQNEVFFSDVTAYTVAGMVVYEDVVGSDTLTYPAADVTIHVDKGDLPSDDNVKTATGADGRYAVSVDPSTDASDPWFVMTSGPTTADVDHTFVPAARELVVRADTSGINFLDLQRNVLSGNFSGGDPISCGVNIGSAELRIATQDGVYRRTYTVDSAVMAGAFSLDLPPLEYLIEVVPLGDAPAERRDDIAAFFEALGQVEVDLRAGDVERNLTYRAPLTLQVAGLPTNSCRAGLSVLDQDDNPLRLLPQVPVIDAFDTVPLTIVVTEDYGDAQTCNVTEGTITIFDAIADRADADSTLAIADAPNGVVSYSTFGASPNIFTGARIDGRDRSLQKPITVVAQVEGRPALVETQWALVNGYRERAATFVSATTEPFPLMVLYDPPGSQSYAYIEKDKTMCSRISNTRMVGGGAGAFADLNLGFANATGFSLGAHFELPAGIGIHFDGRTTAGREDTNLGDGPNREICFTTSDRWATSSDPGWVGEDLYMGVALNLIFALADVVDADAGSCEVVLSEELATDIDAADPFETAYVYGKTHIKETLIPQLEQIIRLGGDGTLTGEVEGEEESVRLQEALANWNSQLAYGTQGMDRGVERTNRSFSGGAEIGASTTRDTTRVTRLESSRIYLDSSNNIGVVFKIGFDSKFGIAFDIQAEWVSEREDTESDTRTYGYVLSDNDTGDYFSVDVAKDSVFHTYVFETKAGRSANPCENETQCRDNPIIQVDPVVRYDVDPSDAANFQLTLTNGSESDERRRYVIMAPPETNTNNLGINVGGGLLTSPREYVLEPGRSLTVNMDVFASSSALEYERVGVMMYPPDERPIWGGDPRFPFAKSDTAFFSVFFNPNGSQLQTAQLSTGWNWISINREGGDVNTLLDGVAAEHGDVLRGQRTESRFDSTAGWVGNLTRLSPGDGYRVRLKNAALLRVEGEAIEEAEPLTLAPGWTWIGYIPTMRMPLDEALASLDDRVLEGDAIVGRESFANYVKGVGWVGTLRRMVPGESYAIHMGGGGKLVYPPTPEAPIPSPPYVHETTTEGPEWVVDSRAYDGAMTVVGEIQLHSDPLRRTTMKVAAFDGDEIRGVGEVHYVEALDRYLTFLMLFGDVDEQRPLVVSVYDGETDELYEAVATINYEQQGQLGHPTAPVVFELANAGLAPELSDLPDVVALHPNFPNPVGQYTIIGYDLPEAAHVRVAIYDVLGRQVSTLVDQEQPAGRHRAVFNASSVASGVYFYRLELEDAVHAGRMVVVR